MVKIPLFKKQGPSPRPLRESRSLTPLGANGAITIPSYVKNEVSLVDPLYRGFVKSGRTLELSGDGKVDVPINATLGGEELCNTDFVELGCMTALGTPIVTFANNVMTMESKGNNYAFIQQQITCEVGKTYTIEATLTNIDAGGANGALVHIRQSSDDTLIVSLSNTDVGTTKILRDTFVATETTMDVRFTAHTAADGQSASFTQPTVKEIQSTQGQITYYDATQKKYIAPTLSLSTHYQLKDITFNNLCVLYDRSFTQADGDLIDSDPTLLFQWAKGTYSGFSIGAKKPEDKVYMVTEGGAYLLEVEYSEVVELFAEPTVTEGNEVATHTKAGNKITYNITTTGTQIFRPLFNYAMNNGSVAGQLYRTLTDIEVISGSIFGAEIPYNIGSGVGEYPIEILSTGNHKLNLLAEANGSDGTIRYRLGNRKLSNSTLELMEAYKVTSDYLPIQGTYTRLKNQQYGLQTLGLKLNAAGVPTALVDPNTFNFENDDGYVDTQWKPDLAEYTIELIGSTDGVIFTKNTITHDATDTLLYVNDRLLGSTQAPDPTTTFKLHKLDNFGPSILKQHFRVWSKVVIY